jgi:hypothetical protein
MAHRSVHEIIHLLLIFYFFLITDQDCVTVCRHLNVNTPMDEVVVACAPGRNNNEPSTSEPSPIQTMATPMLVHLHQAS